MNLLILILIFILLIIVCLFVKTGGFHVNPAYVKTGGFHVNSSRSNPLVFLSAPWTPVLTAANVPGWCVLKQSAKSEADQKLNKQIATSIARKPTLVLGNQLREDRIYEKPDLHVHMTPVKWDLSNPVELAQRKDALESRGIDFELYWDTLGHQYIDVLVESRSEKPEARAVAEIKTHLADLQRVRAGLVV